MASMNAQLESGPPKKKKWSGWWFVTLHAGNVEGSVESVEGNGSCDRAGTESRPSRATEAADSGSRHSIFRPATVSVAHTYSPSTRTT